MDGKVILLIVMAFALASISVIQETFAQNQPVTSKQTTLSGDLSKDPLAQDILKKIEQTKQWIADLEKRNYEKLEAQKILEEKRAIALERLNTDLKEWEELWSAYSSRASFERFAAKKPSSVQGVFWDQFEFKEIKATAGKNALKKVIAEGGTLREAREAYLGAAETKRIELIEANSQFNVKHNLAYYKQQILFDTNGKFVNTEETQDKLRNYYTDYRANPAYLAANPDDKLAYEELGKTTPDTECRTGYVVIHRFHADDYACVTESTAEMWVRHGMGEILGQQSITTENSETSPMSQCQEGYKLVKVISTGKYSCVTEETATEWTNTGIAESPDVGQYILDQIEKRDARTALYEANEKINKINSEIAARQLEIKQNYDKLYKIKEDEAKDAERAIAKKYSGQAISKEDTIKQIASSRDNYATQMKNILEEKMHTLDFLKNEFDSRISAIEQEYSDIRIAISWNDVTSSFEATVPE